MSGSAQKAQQKNRPTAEPAGQPQAAAAPAPAPVQTEPAAQEQESLSPEQVAWRQMARERNLPKHWEPGTFWWVKFAAKPQKNASNRIFIAHNCVKRDWARGIPTIVPGPFLEIADRTLQDQFRMTYETAGPEQPMAPIQHIQYEILYNRGNNGQATEKEYLALLESGTKAKMDAIRSGNLTATRQVA
jgi:hypothetical protein